MFHDVTHFDIMPLLDQDRTITLSHLTNGQATSVPGGFPDLLTVDIQILKQFGGLKLTEHQISLSIPALTSQLTNDPKYYSFAERDVIGICELEPKSADFKSKKPKVLYIF